MKTNAWHFLAALLLAGLFSGRLPLEAAQTAVVKGDRVNVRGQPTIFSEVVTQLKEGETAVILDEITLAKPKLGEPAKWFKIQMPANVPVWVNAAYINTNDHTVISRKLNLRAGAGENFSVVGVLQKGDLVKPIRYTDEWIEVEGLTNTFAYVASELMAPAPEKPAVPAIAPKPETKTTPPAPAEPSPKPEARPAVAPVVPPPAPPVQSVQQEPPPAPAKDTPAPAPAKIEVKPAPTPVALTPPPVGPAISKVEEPAPRRLVRREGTVRGVGSIQAPTHYQLQSTENGKLINYLHTLKTNIMLDRFKGQKVIVMGEEFMDERWQNTPMLEVETLQPAPNAGE